MVEVDSSGRTLLTYAIEREPPTPQCITVSLAFHVYYNYIMKSTKVQTLGTLYRNVEPIHKCGTTTIDGLDHASKRTACYALFPWIRLKKWPAPFLFEAKNIYIVEKLPTFHLSTNFRIAR